jgi:23S rRNA pseudouridine2605 synthase
MRKNSDSSSSGRPERGKTFKKGPAGKNSGEGRYKKEEKRGDGDWKEKRSFNREGDKRPSTGKFSGGERTRTDRDSRPAKESGYKGKAGFPERKGGEEGSSGDEPRKPYARRDVKSASAGSFRKTEDRAKRSGSSKPFERRKDKEEGSGERSFRKRDEGTDRPSKPFDRKKPFDKDRTGSFKPRGEEGNAREERGERPGRPVERKKEFYKDRPKTFRSKEESGKENEERAGRPARPYEKKREFDKDRPKSFRSKDESAGEKPERGVRPSRPYDKKKEFDKERPKTSRSRTEPGKEREDRPARPFDKKKRGDEGDRPRRPKSTKEIEDAENAVDESYELRAELPEKVREKKFRRVEKVEVEIDAPMTLNKYISHSGESSRRDAAELVKQGKVRVNGELVLEPGYRVVPGDQVTLSGKKLVPQTNLVYILLNKPKGFITTTEDPEERKTVMDLVTNTEAGRLFPVGRLDRNTTGLLLLTNDGTLAHKLAHPSNNIKKVYHVTLDKNLDRKDYEKIVNGVKLEDGVAQVDEIAYLENRHELGLEIHSGKNRIVRRIFESLGYQVEKLDRVMYAGLTKKNLPRGKWRTLNEREIVLLKHFKS